MNKLKRLSASLAVVLFSLPSAVAQEFRHSDFIVLNMGDTLYGNVRYRDENGTGFYNKIRLTNTEGKRKKFKRKNISAFRINNIDYESFWLIQSFQKIMFVNPRYDIDPVNGEQHFLRLVSKGKLSHYELEWIDADNSTLWSMALLKKGDESFFIRADQGVLGLKRKALRSYFVNCPNLIEVIDQKQVNEVSQVVDFYNRNCSD